MKAKWIKITVSLKFDVDSVERTPVIVSQFKALFHVEHLYFARYENEISSTFEISAETSADWTKVKRWFRAQKGVAGVRIEDRGTGSMAHAMAYRAVCALPPFDIQEENGSVGADTAFGDIIHWMANQRGMDYMREIRFYGTQIVYFSNIWSAQPAVHRYARSKPRSCKWRRHAASAEYWVLWQTVLSLA